MKKSILKSISDYIKSRKDHFTSENIETNKIDDKTGNVYVSAFVPRSIMQLHEKE